MKQMVFKAKVITRSFIFDIWAMIKNITGGNVVPYAKVIEESIQQAYDELREEHPKVQNIHLMTSELMKGAAEIIVYGEVNV